MCTRAEADGNAEATCLNDANSAGKKEEITGGVKLYTVEFPDEECASAEVCAIIHDGSLDPCAGKGARLCGC